jgi:formate dehydrogenase maturation protein FdhE
MSTQLKSHLREVEALYRKINSFESAVRLQHTYSPVEGARHYIKEDVRTIVDALSQCLDINPGDLGDLEDAMHKGNIDFTRLVDDNNTIAEEEYQLLYIMSRPFFKSMKSAVNMDDMFWQDGRCPVCSAKPALSAIEMESQRKYFCSFCGTVGSYMRIGCPGCPAEGPQDVTIITLEGEEGMRADTCGKCRRYVKTFESSMTEAHSMDSLDIMSIPLDIIVQEKGFTRHAPNPVGIISVCP